MSNNRNLSNFADNAGAPDTPTLNIPNVGETTTVSATAATGTINFDVITQSILYYTSDASANWTINVRGNGTTPFSSFVSTNQTVTVVFLATQGATPFYASGFNIDGTSQTVKWQGGTAPSAGNASGIDVYSYSITALGAGSYTVLGSQIQFK